MNNKIKEKENKKSFHKIRQIRISDEVWKELKYKKNGTWNYFLSKLIKEYENMA